MRRARRCGAGARRWPVAKLAAREATGCAPAPPLLALGFRAVVASLTLAALTTLATQLHAQSLLDRVFVGLGFGAGQVEYWSDQAAAQRQTTVTASLRFGVVLSPSLRVGIEANGWGIESGDVWDPSKGVTVNETLFIAQVAPWRAKRLHLKGGVGWGEFNTGHADDLDSRAFGAVIVGVGYDVRVSRSVFVTLGADWARGPLGSADPRVTTSTGRRFRGWTAHVGAQWH